MLDTVKTMPNAEKTRRITAHTMCPFEEVGFFAIFIPFTPTYSCGSRRIRLITNVMIIVTTTIPCEASTCAGSTSNPTTKIWIIILINENAVKSNTKKDASFK
jgi:hypothetical protein